MEIHAGALRALALKVPPSNEVEAKGTQENHGISGREGDISKQWDHAEEEKVCWLVSGFSDLLEFSAGLMIPRFCVRLCRSTSWCHSMKGRFCSSYGPLLLRGEMLQS